MAARRQRLFYANLVAALAATLLLPAIASARGDDGRRCCWKIVVDANGSFGTVFEPRVSDEPDAVPGGRGHHEWGDKRGKYNFRWRWQSRGLYSSREFEEGRRRVPVFEALGSGRGFQLATAARGELHSFEEYCLIEHDTEVIDGEVRVVGERCEEPPINPCLQSQVTRWKRGGSSSGVRLHGGPRPRDRRTFLTPWVQNLFPYDGSCTQFGQVSAHHGAAWLGDHGMQGSSDYILLAPSKMRRKLRARRSFSFVPRHGHYTAWSGLRPRIAGTHPVAGEDDDEQPHSYGGKTSVRVKFVYFPQRRLARERRRLPRHGACATPALGARPNPVAEGEQMTFTGACFKPRKRVTLYLGAPRAGVKLASLRTDARGAFTARYTNRRSGPGAYRVLACQNRCRVKAHTRVTVK